MTTAWIWRGLLALAILGIICSTVFLGMVLVAALRYRRIAAAAKLVVNSTPESSLPSVTVLKPVHGTEPRLAENLESFFQQDYPDFEIIIGARDAHNPALQIAQKLRQRYPGVKSRVVLSGPPTWPSAKVFSDS